MSETTKGVGARDIREGDEIDGRRVRLVTGHKPSRCTASASKGATEGQRPGHRLPALTFTSKVITVYFEDDGAPKRLWPEETVEVIRS